MRARALARRAIELTSHPRARASTRVFTAFTAESSSPSASAAESSSTSFPRPRVYVETYGCQMNASDSDVVRALLLERGFDLADDLVDAQAALVNTCAIRDAGAESRVLDASSSIKGVKARSQGKFARGWGAGMHGGAIERETVGDGRIGGRRVRTGRVQGFIDYWDA